MWAPEDLKCF